MLRLSVVFVFLAGTFAFSITVAEGCHAGHSQQEDEDYDEEEGVITPEDYDDDEGILDRKKRQVKQVGDDFAILRKYFRDCMLDKVTERWDWRSIIDFTILKTLWYFYSGSVACSKKDGKDNSQCWNGCIDAYLKNSSNMIGAAKECVKQYELDYSVEKASYTPTFTKKWEPPTSPPKGKYLECVQTQYNEADPQSVFENTGVLVFPPEEPLNIYTVATFVRIHVRCVICDYSNLPSGLQRSDFKQSYEITDRELRDVYSKTWPFSFEASVRQDARLRYAINFCNGEYEVTFRKDPPPNLGWTQWYIWGNCNAACGGSGIQSRIRVCLDESGRNCTGKSSEKRKCNRYNCAHWSNWSKYTPCVSTCDVSEQYSFRRCKNGNIGDEGCRGPRRRTKSCAVSSCEVPWSTWSACSVTCGSGVQHRSGGESLLHVRTEKRRCRLRHCPEKWTHWSSWGPCSRTCGNGGKRERVRKCLSKICSAQSKQSMGCTKPACKQAWDQWTPWSGCVYKRRTRVCRGSSDCKGESERYQRCISTDCAVVPHWSHWSAWSKCDSYCGPGRRRRNRNCLRHTSHSPLPCTGMNSEYQMCSNMPCHISAGKRPCDDQYGWHGFCHQMRMKDNCFGDIRKVKCRKSCRYC